MRTNPVCWFEVADFLDYVQKHPAPSGIQRVEREILTRLEMDYVPSARAAACRLDPLTHAFEPVDLSFLLDPAVDWSQRGAEPRPSFRTRAKRWLSARVTRGPARRHQVPFGEGDLLVSLGGAWHDRGYPDVLGRLRSEKGVRVAFLLHDIIPVSHPEWVVPTLAEGFRAWIGKMAEIADLVFTSSRHVRREFLAWLDREQLRPPRVDILRFASGFERWNPAAHRTEASPLELPREFALFVSTVESRKNHTLLIEVWRRLVEKHGWDGVPHLVLAGRPAFGADNVVRLLEENRYLDGKVRLVSGLTDAELEQAYRSCRITVFPSLLEGWGLPVTESLAYGKLCVASSRASIPEAGGDLVDYFDPGDPEDALRKIEQPLFDPDYLLTREREIASRFSKVSWKTYTDDMMRMLGRLSHASVTSQVVPNVREATSPAAEVVVRVTKRRDARCKRILVLKLDHLGDMVLAVPALARLREAFYADEITLVCGSWNKGFAESLGIFDRVLTHDYQPRNACLDDALPLEPMSHFDSLLSGAYDIAIDLKADADTRVFLTRVNAAARCGFGSADRFPFLDLALPLGAGRVALHETGPPKYAFAPGDFFSRVRGNDLFLETDFTVTDLCIVYGPYAALPKGDFIARFYVTAGDLGSQKLMSSITFDVAKDEKRLASVPITKLSGRAHLKSGMIAIPFSNDDADGLFEFRVSTKGRPYEGWLRFFGVTVQSVSPADSAPRHRSDKLHLSELMSLLVQLVAERFGLRKSLPDAASSSETLAPKDGELEAFLALKETILIAPFSNKATRDWPLSYYERLIEMIVSKFDNPVGLLGAAEHADALDDIVHRSGSPRLHNLAGKAQWSDLPHVFERARVVVSNNSGIAHFAAACCAPLVAIYSGAVLAEEWGPRGENTIVTLTADVPCSPCGYDRLEQCGHGHRCMRLISAESVFAEVSKLLGASAA